MPNAVEAFGRISAPMWLMPTRASRFTPSHLVMMYSRDHRDLERDHERGHDHREQQAAAEEPVAGEGVPGQRADHQVADDRGLRSRRC